MNIELRCKRKINTQFNLGNTGNWVDYHGNKSLLKIHVIAIFRNITSLFKISKISFFVLRQCNSLFPANKKSNTPIISIVLHDNVLSFWSFHHNPSMAIKKPNTPEIFTLLHDNVLMLLDFSSASFNGMRGQRKKMWQITWHGFFL